LRKLRKRTRVDLTRTVLRKITRHPANEGQPIRAIARAMRWQATKRLRSHHEVDVYGARLRLPSWSGGLSNLQYFGPCFEWENVHLAQRLLRAGDSVLDLGANVGLFSFACAEALERRGRIDAFEGHPDLAAVIRENVVRNALDDVIHVHACAVSDTAGALRFTDRLDVSGRIVGATDASVTGPTIEVPAVRLDEAVRGRAYVLAKLDVEGAELDVLRGYREHLERGNPSVLIVEAREHMLHRLGASRDEVLAMLLAFDYELCSYDVAEHTLRAAPTARAKDVVAVHRQSRPMVERRLR
jgi:FkbM family methyltransferase